ncbi:hypothetical protein PVL29_006331 [Vitis rotundifolia]|uniref:Protein kinase domain-containing protein n=1 Tax=Vitis rotundifolia TaxID=103349 RepID=A0AA39A512_VITRO|nr:hypothetical protein PVL29_006331 [Vitis rotundifolia]
MIDTDQSQPKGWCKGFNENHQMVYEPLNGILGLRRGDSECSSDILDFVPAKGYAAEVENRVCLDKASGIHREYSAPRLGSGQLFEDFNCNQAVPGHATPSFHIPESPQPHHCQGSGVSDASFSDKMKFLCSFGGRILPRPNDGKLRYVGGETKIISIRKNLAWVELVKKTSAICNQLHTIKYQLPGEDLDALISVSSDEDLHHMIEEYHELERIEGSQRLRIFLVPVGEPESPSSFETRATQQNEADYQYVVAVNGMLDPSPRKNSSGQSVSSQTGNTCDYRDPPTFFHPLEMKDGTSSSNLVGRFTNPAAQFLTSLQIPTKSFQQSPPVSPLPVQNRDPQNSAMHFFEDHAYHDGHESTSRFVTDQWPCDNAYCVDSPSYHHNNPYGPVPLMNYHHHNKHFLETDQINKLPSLHVQNRPSRDFVFSPVHGQSEVDFERPVLKESAFHSHHKDPLGLLSGSTNDLVGSHHRMLHVLSDSQLRGHEGRPDYHLEEGITPLSPWTFEVQKSPSLALSNSSQEWSFQPQEISNEKYQEAYQNQPTLMVNDHKGNNGLGQGIWSWEDEIDTQVGQERKHDKVITNLTSQDNSTPSNTKLQNVCYNPNSVPSIHISPLEFQDHGDTTMNSALALMIPENSADIVREQPHDYSLGASTSKFLVKSQNATKDMQHAMTEVISSESVPNESSRPLPVAIQGAGDQEAAVPSSASLTPSAGNKSDPSLNLQKNYPLSTESSFENPDKNAVMGGVSTLKDEDPLNFPYHEVEGPEGHSYERLNPGDAIFVQSQPSDNHHNGNMPGAAVIVEDVTDILRPGIPSSSPLIPQVEDEANDEITSSGEAEAESDIQESEGEEGRDLGESISDAAMAEMEASIYGLQIIKNADLEELKELGSGTFGTVYHGKWRGTDVAIKRIKKSCFAGRSSEQERLTKDFWREARILSNLHHPNVVALYGVVPDGPGGTLATVTEYMVNGSLRHVLQRKDRSLDRRKRLIIAMDAAFGMEYLHLKNIVHFDLKCDNLLVNMRDTQRPICKVGDFGLSRIKRNTLVSGGVRGTLPWMAPELLNGSSSRVSEKVDVFSFGVAMWEILTGEEPYANMHCGAIIGGIVSNTLRPPIPERCDPDWRKLMEECWSPDPAARPSFTEITNRLRVMSMAIQTKRHYQANR